MKNVKIKTNTTTPVSTATGATATVLGTAVPFIAKTLVGVVTASVATVLTGKLLKTGASQKAYEEAVKEFTSK